ncbi:hypothetical protein [Mycobacterium sp. 852002-51163_SCH5372311]|nr:hypothetical protein [Mycobacterium sp. 852002-51163_SCH5372311]
MGYVNPNPSSVYAEECPCANGRPCREHGDPGPAEPDDRYLCESEVA